ncbi:MAG: hypothetical protein WCC37_09760, partial [Candidatus Sulfotelmatobacter sp.]
KDPLDADVLAHDFSDVIVGAHEAAVLVQAKPGAEIYGQRSNIPDVGGLEIRDGKDDALGNEFLSVHRQGKGE